MSLTYTSLGNLYQPAYNPIVALSTSNSTTQPNFEYVYDIMIEGVTFSGGATSLRLKSPADPIYGSGAVNIAPIVQKYLTGDIGDDIYGFQQCSNSIKRVTVSYGEMYGVSSGVIYYSGDIDRAIYVFNGSLSQLEYINYSPETYVADTSSLIVNLLSNQPSSGTIDISNITNGQWIYAMSQTSGAIKFANINSYNAAGTLTNTARVINQYHNTTTTANRMIRFPAGYNISLIPIEDIVSGTLANFTNTTTNYKWEIYFTDSAHNRITQSFYSKWNTDCTEHTNYHIYFKNKFGGYDTFDFTRASQKSTDIIRKQYEKTLLGFTSNYNYNYTAHDRFNTSFYTSYKYSIKIQSNWITEDQSIWLTELLTSSDIRVDNIDSIKGNNYLVPINIIDTKYIQRQHLTDKIFNIEITFQFSFNEIRQGA